MNVPAKIFNSLPEPMANGLSDLFSGVDFDASVKAVYNAGKEDYSDLSNYPVTETISDGVYYREVFIPAGHFMLGRPHLKSHFAVMFTGKALLATKKGVEYIEAPWMGNCDEGIKSILVLEDVSFAAIHSTTKATCEEAFNEVTTGDLLGYLGGTPCLVV